MESDPKSMYMVKGILRSQLLVIHGKREQGRTEMKNHKLGNLFLLPFISTTLFIGAVTKDQKKMDFLLPSKRIQQQQSSQEESRNF